jgi:hypothetical protein
MDPATLSAAAIATLVVTKAFEKTGEVIGEKALEQGGKLVRLLKDKFPNTATAIERAEQQPLNYGEALLISKDVELAANSDREIAETVDAVAKEVQIQIQNSAAIHQLVQNVIQYGKFSTSIGSASNFTIGDKIGKDVDEA